MTSRLFILELEERWAPSVSVTVNDTSSAAAVIPELPGIHQGGDEPS